RCMDEKRMNEQRTTMKIKVRSAKHLVVVACALLVAQSALAFYHPSASRWLSRDPIEERGALGRCTFLENNPINSWDYLGLCGPAAGSCGPDVTRALNQTLRIIKARYQQVWSGFQKYRACVNLYGPYAS